jgi:hypothetical protein
MSTLLITLLATVTLFSLSPVQELVARAASRRSQRGRAPRHPAAPRIAVGLDFRWLQTLTASVFRGPCRDERSEVAHLLALAARLAQSTLEGHMDTAAALHQIGVARVGGLRNRDCLTQQFWACYHAAQGHQFIHLPKERGSGPPRPV